jgi:nucleoside-diphosphate-sugar epimerase
MKISIIGLGWFGEALGHALKDQNEILGSTRSELKAQQLRQKGFKPLVLEYPQLPSDELLSCDLIILNIPPRADHIAWFKSWAWKSDTQIIFISPTSVYGDHQGSVNEETIPEPDTEGGKILIEQESYFRGFKNSAIIRFGGLFGAGRHPGKFLSGRKNLEGAQRPVNLVHQKDTVGFVKTVIEKNLTGTFNLVHPDHPNRELFYRSFCERKGLPLPEFTHQTGPSKVINSSSISSLYRFQAALEDD